MHPLSSGFTRRIIGVPKAESDAILTFLFHQLSENPDFQVRFRWEKDSIAIWDNRVSPSQFLGTPSSSPMYSREPDVTRRSLPTQPPSTSGRTVDMRCASHRMARSHLASPITNARRENRRRIGRRRSGKSLVLTTLLINTRRRAQMSAARRVTATKNIHTKGPYSNTYKYDALAQCCY